MTISIIGCGRLGACLGAVMAQAGFKVLITDKNFKKKELFKGKSFFYEPDLAPYFNKYAEKLIWTQYVDKVLSSEFLFFCLSLPHKKTGETDLTPLLEWVRWVPDQKDKFVVLKSTLPLGSNRQVGQLLKKTTVISCPEFLREGQAISDILHPERLVIGARDQLIGQKLAQLYQKFSKPKKVIHTDPETAELSKLACNSFLATKISFINEWAGLCEKTQANIQDLKSILASDSRMGKEFFNPGLGYGGACLPKDLQLSIYQSDQKKYSMELLKSVQKRNLKMSEVFFKNIKNHYGRLKNLKLCFWGLSFKKNTDNLKNSPALILMNRLLKAGVQAHIYDPLFVEDEALKIFTYAKDQDNDNEELNNIIDYIYKGRVFLYKEAKTALDQKEGLIVSVACEEFLSLSLKEIKQSLSHPFLVDGRNLYSQKDLKKQGFYFYQRGSIGYRL